MILRPLQPAQTFYASTRLAGLQIREHRHLTVFRVHSLTVPFSSVEDTSSWRMRWVRALTASG